MSRIVRIGRVLILSVVALTLFAAPALADTALNFTDTQTWGFLFPITFGWEFTVSEPITVDQLGIRDAFAPGFYVSHAVGIYRVSDNALLVSATITSSDALDGLFRYTAVTPTTLQPGVVYLCAGFDPRYQSGAPLDYVGLPEIAHLTSTVAPPITYRGWAYGETDGLEFPLPYNVTMDPWANSVGHLINANFKFSSSTGCALLTVTEGSSRSLPVGLDSSQLLGTLRSFRDELLEGSEDGRELARLYYQVSPELAALLLSRPGLSLDVLSVLSDVMPAFRKALSTDGVLTLDRHTVEKVFALTHEIAAEASPELRAAISTAQRFATTRMRQRAGTIEFAIAGDAPAVLHNRQRVSRRSWSGR